MFDIASILDVPPYSLGKREKIKLFSTALIELTEHHYNNCREYQKLFDSIFAVGGAGVDICEMPFLPVSLFKDYELYSVEKNLIVKTITSSGTKNSGVSKIYLDKNTATNQAKVLAKLIGTYIGSKRVPLLVIDSEEIARGTKNYTARAAGIAGFSIFGKDVTYALNNSLELDIEVVDEYFEKYSQEKIMMFGFTYIVWEAFYKKIVELGKRYHLDNGVMFHGGGWKNMTAVGVDNSTFKNCMRESIGVSQVVNYYGMAEQTGSIFLECEEGFFHCSNFSEIVIRKSDLSLAEFGECGIVQLFSLLPTSYPGHILLSEDRGIIHGEDDCKCGRMGKRFTISGRLDNVQLRGCSDVSM